jgi:hypothetical protein
LGQFDQKDFKQKHRDCFIGRKNVKVKTGAKRGNQGHQKVPKRIEDQKESREDSIVRH